ncbi:MAG TPA: TonB-dependent receptor [Candidatus Acidoferrum sp.]|nr:TonB-dependent receptor [Candidatus Acidoferrum sp.]
MKLHGLVFLLLLTLPLSAFSQTNQKQATATLQGALTDPSGAAVADARVTATAAGSTSATATATSGADGRFSLALAAGNYTVRVEHASFHTAEQEFSLAAGETRTWDVRLALETLSSNVVVSATAEPTTLAETVSPVDILTRDDFNQRQQIWLTPAYQSLPGASISQLGPMGGSTSFFLDGGNSYYTKVLIDGVPTNQPGVAIDFSNFALDGVDKVEVVHGASSALYGSDAMSGVMQIFTHRGSTRTPVLELEGDGGTFDTGHGGGQLSGELGAFDYSATAAYFGSNGQGPDDYFRDTTLSGNFGYKFSDTNTLRLTVRNSSSDAGQYGQSALDPPVVEPGQHTVLHDFSSGLTWDYAMSPNLANHLMGFENRDFEIEDTPEFGPPYVSQFNRAGLDEQVSYAFPHGGVTAGYYFEVENGGATGRTNQAGYIELHYQLATRLTATAGGRMEGNQFFGTRFVPRVGLAYALHYGNGFWGDTKLRASYGKGISEPELLPADCSPQLEPEEARTVDAGFDQTLAGNRIHWSTTAFFNQFHNIVSFDFTALNPNCPAYGGSFFNSDLARANGAFSKFEIKATNWLMISGQYTYDDSKVLKSPNATDPAQIQGNRLLKRPLHSAFLMANTHVRYFNFNFSGTYVGRRADSDFEGYGITSNPSYVRWDTAASVPLHYGLTLTAQVQNLFDRQYQDAVGYPALGRNYRLGVKYVWGGKE